MQATPISTRGRVLSVRRYGSAHRQPPHTDRHSRVSLLLRGELCEESRTGSLRLGPGDLLLKSRQVEHEDRFSDAGAVILSLEFISDDPFEGRDPLWRRRNDPAAVRLGVCLIEAAAASDQHSLEAVATDLVADGAGEDVRAEPPAWLAVLREELEGVGLAGVDVAARARAAGVHAVHASRLFRRCFGVSITDFAQAHAVRRAVAIMAQPGVALSEAALAAGFYDQSHMSRVFHRVSGRPPGRLRAVTESLVAMAG